MEKSTPILIVNQFIKIDLQSADQNQSYFRLIWKQKEFGSQSDSGWLNKIEKRFLHVQGTFYNYPEYETIIIMQLNISTIKWSLFPEYENS